MVYRTVIHSPPTPTKRLFQEKYLHYNEAACLYVGEYNNCCVHYNPIGSITPKKITPPDYSQCQSLPNALTVQ